MSERGPDVVDLRTDLADVLDEADGIGPDDNLLDAGMDSVRLMMLTQRWQDAGVDVDFMSLVQAPTLAEWQRLLAEAPRLPVAVPDVGDGPVTLDVVRVEQRTPRIMRVTLGGAGVARFAGALPGQHTRVLVPGADATRPVTVRYHPASGELDVEVVVHDGGPLGRWAGSVRPGSSVRVDAAEGAGPAFGADWTVLVADPTGLPALVHLVESAPAGRRVIAVGIVPDGAEEQLVQTVADAELHWLYHGDDRDVPFADLVRELVPATGTGAVRVAGEAGLVEEITGALRPVPGAAVTGEVYWRADHPSP